MFGSRPRHRPFDFEDLAVVHDRHIGARQQQGLPECHLILAVSTGRLRASSNAFMTPTARRPLPPMKYSLGTIGHAHADPFVKVASAG